MSGIFPPSRIMLPNPDGCNWRTSWRSPQFPASMSVVGHGSVRPPKKPYDKMTPSSAVAADCPSSCAEILDFFCRSGVGATLISIPLKHLTPASETESPNTQLKMAFDPDLLL